MLSAQSVRVVLNLVGSGSEIPQKKNNKKTLPVPDRCMHFIFNTIFLYRIDFGIELVVNSYSDSIVCMRLD